MRQVEQQGGPKTLTDTITPMSGQQPLLAFVVRRRARCNAAPEARREAWRVVGISVTLASQRARLPANQASQARGIDPGLAPCSTLVDGIVMHQPRGYFR